MSYSTRKLLVGGGPQLLIDVGSLTIFAAALLGIVNIVFHLPLGALPATSGVIAAIIGLAIQRMISDVFAGLALNVEHPFAIGDEAIQTLGLTAHVHEYPDARIIINQGDPGSSLFVVIAGLLEVAQCDASGRHGAVGRLVPGDVFGEISLLTGARVSPQSPRSPR